VGLLGLICLLLVGWGATPAETWILALEGEAYGAFLGAAVSGDTILAVGATNHLHVPPYDGDVLLVRANLEGDILWEQTWGGDGYEQAWDAAPLPGGEFLVFGETDSFGAGDRDFFLMKLDADGATAWVETYGTTQREWPFGLLELSSGDVLLYGRTQDRANGPENLYALRVTTDGDVVWEFSLSTPASEMILDAVETEDGDIVLCVSRDQDPALVRLNAAGRILWNLRYDLPGWQFGSAIAPADDGFLLAGFAMAETGRRQADVWLARVTSAGELLWQTTFGRTTEDDYAQSLLRLADGTYLVGGLGSGLPLFLVDGNGTVLWERRLEDSAVFAAHTVIDLADDGFLVAALRQIVNGRSYDAFLLRTDRDGQVSP